MFGRLFGKRDNLKLISQIDYSQFFISKEIDGIQIELLNIGKLNITSGKIIVSDPLVYLSHSIPLNKTIKPGTYDVTVCVAKTEEMGERYAIVMVKFTDKPAVKWEMALTERDNIDELKNDGDYFGFPVDAGLGSFCDLETQNLYNGFVDDFYSKRPEGNIYDDYFAAEFKKNAIDKDNPHDIGDWLNFVIPGSEKHNVVMFHSGFGDGYYPCYWGIDAKGDICSLIVDFMVFGCGEDEE